MRAAFAPLVLNARKKRKDIPASGCATRSLASLDRPKARFPDNADESMWILQRAATFHGNTARPVIARLRKIRIGLPAKGARRAQPTRYPIFFMHANARALIFRALCFITRGCIPSARIIFTLVSLPRYGNPLIKHAHGNTRARARGYGTERV